MGDAIPISCLGLSENGHDFMGHETQKILTYFHRFIMTKSLLWVRWVIPLLGKFSISINRDMESIKSDVLKW
jgi:hypothetical protein